MLCDVAVSGAEQGERDDGDAVGATVGDRAGGDDDVVDDFFLVLAREPFEVADVVIGATAHGLTQIAR